MVAEPRTDSTQIRRPKLEQRKAQTRAAIIDAASKLFREHGIDETSMAQIAEHAETGVGTLYGYFPSKDHLLREILGTLTRAVSHRYLASITDESTHLERLLTALGVYAEFLEENRVILRSAFMAGNRHEMAADLGEPMFAAFARLTREGFDAGEFKPLPVESTIRVLITSYTMAFLGLGAWAGVEDTRSIRQELDTIVRALVEKP